HFGPGVHDRGEQGLRVAGVPVQGVTLPEPLDFLIGERRDRVNLGRECLRPLGVLRGVLWLALVGRGDVGGGGRGGRRLGGRRHWSALHSRAHERLHVIGGRSGGRG